MDRCGGRDGAAGRGRHSQRSPRTRAFFSRNANVPMIVLAVGESRQIAAALPELGRMLDEPLLTLERMRVCKRDGQLLALPQKPPATDAHGLSMWQKLTVICSQTPPTKDSRSTCS